MANLYKLSNPPLKNTAFTFDLCLFDTSGKVKTSPTLAAGDIQVSQDGGAFANIASLPTEIGSTGVLKVTLTATEMNADRVAVKFHDAAGDEWVDLVVTFSTVQTETISPLTTSQTASAVLDAIAANYNTAGTIGGAINSASGADPLLNIVPGAYGVGTAGYNLGRLGSGQIITTSIVAQSGNVTTYRGDTYEAVDGRAIDWTDVSVGWPDLTAATILVVIGGDVSFAGSVVTPSGANKKVRLELTSAESLNIPDGELNFVVRATLSGGNVVTLVDGTWISKKTNGSRKLNMIYPYNKPIILTDDIVSAYGLNITHSTDAQRTAAYVISERQVSEELETYLCPTIITGTYLYDPLASFLILDNTYVTKIYQTSFLDKQEKVYWSQTGTDNIFVSLRDGERGLVDIDYLIGACGCGANTPYKVQMIYQCGLSSGSSYAPDLLLALTTYADIVLNEIIGYGNESPGDIGVQSYNNQGYSESRIALIRTSFGSSARAQICEEVVGKIS